MQDFWSYSFEQGEKTSNDSEHNFNLDMIAMHVIFTVMIWTCYWIAIFFQDSPPIAVDYYYLMLIGIIPGWIILTISTPYYIQKIDRDKLSTILVFFSFIIFLSNLFYLTFEFLEISTIFNLRILSLSEDTAYWYYSSVFQGTAALLGLIVIFIISGFGQSSVYKEINIKLLKNSIKSLLPSIVYFSVVLIFSLTLLPFSNIIIDNNLKLLITSILVITLIEILAIYSMLLCIYRFYKSI